MWGCACRQIFGVSGDYTVCWRKRQRKTQRRKEKGSVKLCKFTKFFIQLLLKSSSYVSLL